MTTPTRRAVLGTILAAPAALIVSQSYAAGHATTHEVAIEGFAFSPAELTVAVGDTVNFTNADGAPHTATALDGSFDTGRLNRGDAGSITIETAGTFSYKCNFHPNMTGTINAA